MYQIFTSRLKNRGTLLIISILVITKKKPLAIRNQKYSITYIPKSEEIQSKFYHKIPRPNPRKEKSKSIEIPYKPNLTNTPSQRTSWNELKTKKPET